MMQFTSGVITNNVDAAFTALHVVIDVGGPASTCGVEHNLASADNSQFDVRNGAVGYDPGVAEVGEPWLVK
jgi:hypothetical protein